MKISYNFLNKFLKNFVAVLVLFISHNVLATSTLSLNGCSGLKVITSLSSCHNCYNVTLAHPNSKIAYRFSLERKTTSGWYTVTSQYTPNNNSFTFNVSNNQPGLYRVATEVVVASSTPASYYGQQLGWVGSFSFREYSNVVAFGDAHVSWSFYDANGPDDNQYDENERVYINAQGCYGYDRYRIVIQKNGQNSGQYDSNWRYTTNPLGIIDITPYFNGFGGMQSGDNYHVMLAVQANCDPDGTWNNIWRSFQVCPANAGCRENSEIKIYPNPVSDILQIQNTEKNDVHRLDIVNNMGQIIQTELVNGRQEFDVRSIPAGSYHVRMLSEDNQMIDMQKIVVYR